MKEYTKTKRFRKLANEYRKQLDKEQRKIKREAKNHKP